MRRLSTTSYGVLGMLAMRPWSAYELSTEVRHWLSYCVGPRAETSIYQEPKNLVAHGYARSKIIKYGQRTRTEYSITPAGRKALRKWMAQSSNPPVFEADAMVRMTFGEYGDREALLATLEQLETQVGSKRQDLNTSLADFFGKVGVTPGRVALAPIATKLYFDYLDLLENWARWARSEIQQWPAELPEVTPEVLEAVRSAFERSEPPASS